MMVLRVLVDMPEVLELFPEMVARPVETISEVESWVLPLLLVMVMTVVIVEVVGTVVCSDVEVGC
jgi:hypothetical protein